MLHGLPLYGEAFLPRNRRDACPSCHGHNGRMGRHACECRQDAGAQGKAKGREWACPQVWGRIGSACPSTGGKKRRMAEQGIGLPGTRLRTAVPVVCFGRQPDLPAVETGASFAAILRPCPADVLRLRSWDGWRGRHLHAGAWRVIKEEVLFFVGSLTCLSIFLAWRLAAPWCAPFLAVCVTALLQVLAAMGGAYHEVRLAVAILSILSLLPVCLSLFTAGVSRRHYIGTAAPSLLFAGLLLLFAWHYAGARLVYWDEFFWGASSSIWCRKIASGPGAPSCPVMIRCCSIRPWSPSCRPCSSPWGRSRSQP